MKRTLGHLFLTLSSLTGCSGLDQQSRVNPVSVSTYVQSAKKPCPLIPGFDKRDRAQSIDLSCFHFSEEPGSLVDIDGKIVTEFPDATAYALAVINKTARTRLTSILVSHSDAICSIELGHLTADEAAVNTVLSTINSGLSIASTIVGGEMAKSILSGGAALAGASRDHINVHVYRNAVAYSVNKVIKARRATLLAAINGHRNDGLASWTIDDAIRSVNEYHQECSLASGLRLLAEAANTSEELAAAKLRASQESCFDRVNREIVTLQGQLSGATEEHKKELSDRVTALSLMRSKIGIDADPAGNCNSQQPNTQKPEPPSQDKSKTNKAS